MILNVEDVWLDYTEEGDTFYSAIAEIGKESVIGKVYVEFDTKDIEDFILQNEKNVTKFNHKQLKNAIACYMLKDIKKYLELPKLSETSNLLQCCFENVMNSDNNMFFIDKEDWETWFCVECGFCDNDLDILSEEITKYGLQDVIVLYDYDLITAYGDLRFHFIF